MLPEQRIILAGGSRLLNSMLGGAFSKEKSLKVVREVVVHKILPPIIAKLEVDWVIMSATVDNCIPEWANAYIVKHPNVHLMVISIDCNTVKVKWSKGGEEELGDTSLNEFIRILGSNGDRPAG